MTSEPNYPPVPRPSQVDIFAPSEQQLIQTVEPTPEYSRIVQDGTVTKSTPVWPLDLSTVAIATASQVDAHDAVAFAQAYTDAMTRAAQQAYANQFPLNVDQGPIPTAGPLQPATPGDYSERY